jgi:hypothetical protein
VARGRLSSSSAPLLPPSAGPKFSSSDMPATASPRGDCELRDVPALVLQRSEAVPREGRVRRRGRGRAQRSEFELDLRALAAEFAGRGVGRRARRWLSGCVRGACGARRGAGRLICLTRRGGGTAAALLSARCQARSWRAADTALVPAAACCTERAGEGAAPPLGHGASPWPPASHLPTTTAQGRIDGYQQAYRKLQIG